MPRTSWCRVRRHRPRSPTTPACASPSAEPAVESIGDRRVDLQQELQRIPVIDAMGDALVAHLEALYPTDDDRRALEFGSHRVRGDGALALGHDVVDVV